MKPLRFESRDVSQPVGDERTFVDVIVNVKSPEALEKAREVCRRVLPTEAADQLMFILGHFLEEDFANHCNEAVEALARQLWKRFGDEPSFFDEAPGWSMVDLRSGPALPVAHWQGEFHSVALLHGLGNDGKPAFVLIDPTARHVHVGVPNQTSFVFVPGSGDMAHAKETLKRFYGGSWTPKFAFDHGKKVWIG